MHVSQKILLGVVTAMLAVSLVGAEVVEPNPGPILRGREPNRDKDITGLDTENNGGNAGRGRMGPNIEVLKNAEKAFEVVDTQLRTVFNDTPEMKSAAQALHSAQQRVNTAYAAVMKKLAATPAYSTAIQKRDAAQKKLQDLKANSDRVAASEITGAAADVMNHGSVVTKLQSDALRNDADHTEAKKLLSEASAKVAELQKKLGETLTANPDWAAKKKSLDDARARFTSSK